MNETEYLIFSLIVLFTEHYFVSAGDCIKIWNPDTFEVVKQFSYHDDGNIKDVAWNRDNTVSSLFPIGVQGGGAENHILARMPTLRKTRINRRENNGI